MLPKQEFLTIRPAFPMENIILFDTEARGNLLPLTFTRPVCELRIGILTIREKWEKWLQGKASYITEDYLTDKFDITIAEKNFIINGSVLPSKELCTLISQMEDNESFLQNGELIVAKIDSNQFDRLMNDEDIGELTGYEVGDTPFLKINHLWDIFLHNDAAIRSDFELLTTGRQSNPLSDSNRVFGRENIFLAEGAKIEGASLNATLGPIYIGKEAEIMEGAAVRGPFSLGKKARLKMGAKVYGPTTIGPFSVVGGEVKNSLILGHSNKAHDGYLGNSVIGEWCNLGADTNNSNLKNNYSEVRLWNYISETFEPTGQQFCGLIMGDHSKCAINTMFNTGTVVGVSANIFGGGFPPNFVPSFSWGGVENSSVYQFDKAFETAERVMNRRNKELNVYERLILLKVFEETAKFRKEE